MKLFVVALLITAQVCLAGRASPSSVRSPLLVQLKAELASGIESPDADLLRLLDDLAASIHRESGEATQACEHESQASQAEDSRLVGEVDRLAALIERLGRDVSGAQTGIHDETAVKAEADRVIGEKKAEVEGHQSAKTSSAEARSGANALFTRLIADHETYKASIGQIRQFIRESRLHGRATTATTTGALAEVFAQARVRAAATRHSESIALLESLALKVDSKDAAGKATAPLDDLLGLLSRMEERVESELARLRQREADAVHAEEQYQQALDDLIGALEAAIGVLEGNKDTADRRIHELTAQIEQWTEEGRVAAIEKHDAEQALAALRLKRAADEQSCREGQADREAELALIEEIRAMVRGQLDTTTGPGQSIDFNGVGHDFGSTGVAPVPPADTNTETHTPATETDGHLHEVVACEHSVADLACPQGQVVTVTFAEYGKRSVYPQCQQIGTAMTCGNEPADTQKVQTLCAGQTSCAVHASNGVFGDPCLGTFKYLLVRYTCEHAAVRF